MPEKDRETEQLICYVTLKAIRDILGEAYWGINQDCGDDVSDYCEGCRHEKACKAFKVINTRLAELKKGGNQ